MFNLNIFEFYLSNINIKIMEKTDIKKIKPST